MAIQTKNIPNEKCFKIFGEQSTGTETTILVDASGHPQVDVVSISGSTDDSASPTTLSLIGGKYSAAPATRHDGDAVTWQLTSKGMGLVEDANQATDDAAAPTVGPLVMGKFGASSPDANDAAPLRCGATGELVVADINGATDDAAAPTVGPLMMGKFGASTPDANDAAPLQCDATGTLIVAQAVAASLNCTEASAANIKTAVEKMDDWDSVHGSAAGTDGVMLCAHGKNTAPTVVDADDAVKVWADLHGRVQIQNSHAFSQGSGDFQVAAAPCVVHRVIITTTAAGTLTVYNNVAEAAPAALVLTFGAATYATCIDLGGAYLGTGCYVGKDGAWAGEVTVVYDLV